MTFIENGLVIDGTGRPAYPATIVVDGDRIVDVVRGTGNGEPGTGNGERGAGDKDVIDASGCVVTPGFIDAHSHSDTYLLIEPDAPSKLTQGVTTEVNGQCGGSAIPRFGEARLSSDWASMTYPLLGGGNAAGPTWRSMKEYRALFDQVRPAINTVQFVGHNTLRSSVIGYAAERATPETQKRMGDLLAECLDDGGWGLTTGLIYQPGKYSDSNEVKALAKIAADRGGMYATHMRSEGDNILEAIDEVLDLVRATGIRAEVSHLKTSGKRNWNKIDAVLDKLQSAYDDELIVGSDRYPYCAAGTDLDVVFPDWAGEGGIVAEIRRLADPETRARIIADINASDRDWSTVMIGGTWSDETRPLSGKTIAEILRETGNGFRTPGELVCWILEKDACRTGGFFFGMSESNMRRIFERPWIVPGSDASLRAPWGPLGKDHPHPRAYGTMPRFFRLLTGRTAFGDGVVMHETDEATIARMTSVPAKRFGIKGRGVLEKGAFADVVIWNREEFDVTATFTEPHQFASGVKTVMVNGVVSYSAGRLTGNRAGRFLER